MSLSWLPAAKDFLTSLRALREGGPVDAWLRIVSLANHRLDVAQTNALDGQIRRLFADEAPPALATRPVRLALLGSSTTDHLLPSLRVAAARRGLWIKTYACSYGQYRQELLDPSSALSQFAPDAVLFALDAYHLAASFNAGLSSAEADDRFNRLCQELTELWQAARNAFGCTVLQQTVLPVFGDLVGNNEQRLPGSRARLVRRLNAELRALADAEGVDLVAIDSVAAEHGIGVWHDIGLWHRAKQETSPLFAPLYGDLVARLLAARQGRSFKCLVFDLDNTLWGGVIGDDGLSGLVLGQGSALGEAYLAVQDYARDQARRGIILAVCSKNDEANALEPFERHPEMVLKRSDIACFMANWQDKPSNLRAIAHRLDIGLDAMVFVDDNPFERELVRRELPMVAVPELPDDPALYVAVLTAAGYFEAIAITADDRTRASQYQDNIRREVLRASSTDMDAYLRDLQMELSYGPFDEINLKRATQLINKTNQFNLTTRRYTEDEIRELMADPRAVGLCFRLTDVFGDNGIIGIVILKPADADPGSHCIDTWLMSCRVLGRKVEEAMMNVVAQTAQKLGSKWLLATYRPTSKNAMVRDHYEKLGFSSVNGGAADGERDFRLAIAEYSSRDTAISCVER